MSDRQVIGSHAGARRGIALRDVAVAALIALLLAALFGRIMGYELRRDEFMFVPPAVLLEDHALYSDLFYNHVPYSAWLFRAMHLALPWMGLLAVARLTIFLAWLLLLGSAAWIGWRLTRSAVMALFGPVSFISAEVLLGQAGMAATNNLLPLPFALLGLGLLAISLAERDLSFTRLFAAGVMLSIAAGMKASAIAFIPAVAIGCFLLPRRMDAADRARKLALPVALGGIVGALPLIWLAVTQTDLFFAHIAAYHAGPHIAFWQDNAASEPGLALGSSDKLMLAWSVWMVGAPLLALFVAVLSWAMMRRDPARPDDSNSALLIVAAATATAALLAFVPTPGFPQYYIGPLVGLPLLAALGWRALSLDAHRGLAIAVRVAMALMLVIALPRLGLGLNELRHPDKFTTAKVQRGADLLRQILSDSGLDGAGPVATLSPIYPLAAGLEIYPEFAAGPFAYRIAPYTDAELRPLYAMAGADDLPALFEASPPSAIMTGFDPGLEAPFEDYARANGYTPQDLPAITDRYGSARLWLSPRAAAATEQTGDTQ
ncbi:hypothetical protein FQV27_15750 [Paracoccus aurantiacus]|uniref:Glycosyltransferase RgtA/B/C/D-like domain-containing protein n=1 Tax=Paracoccus aurantiacus TaxID=2599412 RepID=A0A5C6RWM7_9RHOB|nr:hypothetical protein [Paracoccus aurantiacus]TXB66365.1 hypothetical protein FQV27_15750 [Paracoccus aurantiacus]